MEISLYIIGWALLFMLLFKDMSGKEELRKIRIELQKMNKRSGNNDNI